MYPNIGNGRPMGAKRQNKNSYKRTDQWGERRKNKQFAAQLSAAESLMSLIKNWFRKARTDIDLVDHRTTKDQDARRNERRRTRSLQLPVSPIPKYLHQSFGVALDQGKRQYMEDRVKVIDNIQTDSNTSGISYYAVFDGHAGDKAAQICENNFHNILLEQNPLSDGALSITLTNALKAQDKYIIEKGTEENWTEGCCASVVLVRGKTLCAANLGDSHMILGHKSAIDDSLTAIRLSETHKASEESEKQRIMSLGGMVMRGRVFGDLSISRALGDLNFKKPKVEEDFISSDPFTIEINLNPEHLFFIVASDGLWDKISFQEAVEFVHMNYTCTAQQISEMLLKLAQERGSGDNISVIVVLLSWSVEERPKESKIEAPESENSEMDGTVSPEEVSEVDTSNLWKLVRFQHANANLEVEGERDAPLLLSQYRNCNKH